MRPLRDDRLVNGFPKLVRGMPNRTGPIVGRRRHAEERSRRRIGRFHSSLEIDYQDRIRKGIDRCLRRPLSAHEPGQIGLAITAKLLRHGVERFSQMS